MAKKYKQSMKDRMDESKGMKRAMDRDDRSSKAFVTGHDPEIGRDSFAGLPEDKVMSSYPASKMRRGVYLDDTMSDIDAIQSDSERQLDRGLSNQK